MNIYQFLEKHDIRYERQDHPPVFTVDEAKRLVPPLPGAKTKNLFLCDKKGTRHFLVVVGYDKTVDLKALSKCLGMKKLRFGSPERLKRYLNIEPGAVSILGVVNDHNRDVKLFIDEELWHSEAFQCHPLVNTSTLVIARSDLERFLEATGHSPKTISIPAKS